MVVEDGSKPAKIPCVDPTGDEVPGLYTYVETCPSFPTPFPYHADADENDLPTPFPCQMEAEPGSVRAQSAAAAEESAAAEPPTTKPATAAAVNPVEKPAARPPDSKPAAKAPKIASAPKTAGPPVENLIPSVGKNGHSLTQEERAVIAKRKGLCFHCETKTHKMSLFKKTPLTNACVYKGICIRCNPTSPFIPFDILQDFEFRGLPVITAKVTLAANSTPSNPRALPESPPIAARVPASGTSPVTTSLRQNRQTRYWRNTRSDAAIASALAKEVSPVISDRVPPKVTGVKADQINILDSLIVALQTAASAAISAAAAAEAAASLVATQTQTAEVRKVAISEHLAVAASAAAAASAAVATIATASHADLSYTPSSIPISEEEDLRLTAPAEILEPQPNVATIDVQTEVATLEDFLAAVVNKEEPVEVNQPDEKEADKSKTPNRIPIDP